MPKSEHKGKTVPVGHTRAGGITKKRKLGPTKSQTTLTDRQRWLKRLRPRDTLVKRGQATALGIHLVASQLRTLNASLKEVLLLKGSPFGFGSLIKPKERESELLDCLFQVREMITTLGFHLDLEDVTTLPTYVSVTKKRTTFDLTNSKHAYYPLLTRNNKKRTEIGRIALVGLVNRFSSAIFSDHHGLLLHAQVRTKPDLHIYYHSLDATSQFSGSTTVRSKGTMLSHTGPHSHQVSLRGVVGFTEQLQRLMLQFSKINVIVLAEIGLSDAKKLVRPIIGKRWKTATNNSDKSSGANDITILCKPELSSSYSFWVKETAVGNAAGIVANEGTNDECVMLGCHILNSKAKNKIVGKFMREKGVAALFGDTNMSTKAQGSKKFGFETVENQMSVTESLMFDFSNSAANKMFDKLLVRTR